MRSITARDRRLWCTVRGPSGSAQANNFSVCWHVARTLISASGRSGYPCKRFRSLHVPVCRWLSDEGNGDVAGTVELIMTPGHTISIVPTFAHVEVRLGGRLLAATDRAMKLDETGLPTRYYLPREDLQMDLFRPTTFHTTCPFKGEASYWSLDMDGEIHDGIVWSYEAPTARAAEVRGMLSFYPDRTEVTVDGQSLRG
jgi:uncharacterized protein (DUF427 family)